MAVKIDNLLRNLVPRSYLDWGWWVPAKVLKALTHLSPCKLAMLDSLPKSTGADTTMGCATIVANLDICNLPARVGVGKFKVPDLNAHRLWFGTQPNAQGLSGGTSDTHSTMYSHHHSH